MLLGSVEDENRTRLVTVTGIFRNTREQDSIGIAPSCDLYENIVFTDLSTASFLLYGTNSKTSVQYGDFYVNDPDELDRIMAEVQEFPGVDWRNCILTRYDHDYQNAKESLKGLQSIVFIAIAVVSVICFLVLALFLALRLRDCVYETVCCPCWVVLPALPAVKFCTRERTSQRQFLPTTGAVMCHLSFRVTI